MILERLQLGELKTNCYVLGDEAQGKAIVIDPGAKGEKILNLLDELELEIEYIINTHGHHDHIGANKFLLENSEAKLLIHQDDAEALVNPEQNLSFFSNKEIDGPKADECLVEGDQIECGTWSLEVLHTPGHTPGGITLLGNGKLFTGDTLFTMGVGRTDFPNASQKKLMNSIQQKLMPLSDELEVYPGHGPTGKLGKIKATNQFL